MKALVLACVVVAAGACTGSRASAPEEAPAPAPPEWVLNHPKEGAVGQAGFSPYPNRQRELAFARAMTQLAMARAPSQVSLHQDIEDRCTNQGCASAANTSGTIDIPGVAVKCKVRDIWHDRGQDILYVWLVPVE